VNLEIFEFKEKLINDINEFQLPIVVKQMAIQDILNQLNTVSSNIIAQERAEREKAGDQKNG
jgi:ribose 5-phosphate isomerase